MTNIVTCPYCRETVEKPSADSFQPCPKCGYKSARVGSESNRYLIIDSQLPDLISKYDELQQGDDESVIVIDRRIGHNPVAGNERRR
ncbi:MAG: hypothetical protein WC828_05060 [Thermoleophilia bacterium]|jgi:hypothetical protein